MLQIKLRAVTLGPHIAVTLWIGEPGTTFACNGQLKFRPLEWKFFRKVLENRTKAIELMELAGHSVRMFIKHNEDVFGTCTLCGSVVDDECDPDCELGKAKVFIGRLEALKQSRHEVLKIVE